ncbi:hypothetical protein A8C56_10490 [Niabella ginsenosidivorans]|uniref:DUF6850 domain-containing protein n=1 Tax=Niabella ginsenosidivorans TaxID=1176587 RepID=A0A1A9I204_9BACT|nr:DUF6850 family outer membrane beta-barrel protein [Niabella ginsenosidivorans]ANH81355.1 hypothetical protein A8C56_10490 [Niabella ginsenosidivorans]
MNSLHAQVPVLADTLSSVSPDFYKVLQTERSKRLKSDSLYINTYRQQQIQFMQSSLTQLVADTLPQAAMLELGYTNQNRNFKLPVTACKTQNVVLYTEGFTTLGKAKIMGKFYFDKIWEDSLANNLSGNLQNGEPYTHFATKAGNYERQNLNFEAGISYPVIKHLYITSLLNYDYHWSTGSIDPRPDSKLFHLEYTPGITLQIRNITFGATYSLGKRDGMYDIVYKNEMFRTSQQYPERRLYINDGYGYIAQYTSQAYSRSEDRIDAWGVSFATKTGAWNVKANYSSSFAARKNFNLRNAADTIPSGGDFDDVVNNYIKELVHSSYDLTIQKLAAIIYTDNDASSHQISLNGIINEGTGVLMSSSNGASYLFDEHIAGIQYLFTLKKEKKASTEMGIDGGLQHFTKKDFLAAHFYENTVADVSVYAGKYFYRNNQLFKITIKPGFTKPLVNDLSVAATQVNTFTKNVVYPEYDYRGSTFFNGQLGFLYYTPSMLGITGSAVSLNAGFLQKIKDSDMDRKLLQQPASGKNQFNISLGFQIFL